jgi:two-component system nitrogen regulation sensor histidine kinase NtrY
MWLIMIDALALLVLGTLVGRQIWRLWSERRQRLAGHQLHWRMAVLFGGVTTFPAIIVTLICAFCGRLFAAGLVCRAHFNRGE